MALLTKFSPNNLRAPNSRRGVSVDSKVKWKRRARLTASSHAFVEEGSLLKCSVSKGVLSGEEGSFPTPKKAWTEVCFLLTQNAPISEAAAAQQSHLS